MISLPLCFCVVVQQWRLKDFTWHPSSPAKATTLSLLRALGMKTGIQLRHAFVPVVRKYLYSTSAEKPSPPLVLACGEFRGYEVKRPRDQVQTLVFFSGDGIASIGEEASESVLQLG
jgi:hypothetical protein